MHSSGQSSTFEEIAHLSNGTHYLSIQSSWDSFKSWHALRCRALLHTTPQPQIQDHITCDAIARQGMTHDALSKVTVLMV